MKIAILEDDPIQAKLVTSWLTAEGFDSIILFTTGEDFLAGCASNLIDAAILDWELPDTTGIDVLKTLRTKTKHTFPVIFTTARDSEEDIINALNSGADDYLIKPIRRGELLARINVMRRRAGIETPSDNLDLGNININIPSRTIKVNGTAVKVTQKDFEVARILLSNVGKVLSREYLLKEIWGVSSDLNTRTVDVHVSRVRRTLGITPETGYRITTIYQHGYRLEKIDPLD